MKDLIVVIPYFGKEWPVWFDFFLESCKRNTWIDWLIFTDIDFPENSSSNCCFRKMSIGDFKLLANKKLGINPTFQNPYKVCDFRIAFGILFEEEIKGYKYWAHGDIDIVYGNMEKFIRHLISYQYDIISFSSHIFMGCFGLLRNSLTVREKFYSLPKWDVLLEHPLNQAISETHFASLFSKKDCFFQSFDSYHNFVRGMKGARKMGFSFEACWDNGKLFVKVEKEEVEIPFFHFHVFMNKNLYIGSLDKVPWNLFHSLIHVDYKTYKWRINSMGFFPL